MSGGMGKGRIVCAVLLAFFAFLATSCSRPCSRCQGTGKVTLLEPCPQCVGTGSVRKPCPACGGRSQRRGEEVCSYCEGKGRKACTYQETFPYVPYGVCQLPTESARYAPREKVSCVKGRLQGRNPTVDEAFSRTGRSRLCPSCFGTGEVICSVCGGRGKLEGDRVCSTCGGAGEVLESCPRCKGLKTVVQVRPCPACEGKGRIGPFA